MKKLLLLISMLIGGRIFAQSELPYFFPASNPTLGTASKNNSPQLIEGYIAPLAYDLGSLSGNGWYSSADTHNKFGFDIDVTLNSAFIKPASTYFALPNTFTGISFNGTTSGKDRIPTIYGHLEEHPKFSYTSGIDNGKIFEGAAGIEPGKNIGKDVVTIPSLQIGIGLIHKTDLRLRYTPAIKTNSLRSGNWGIGLVHDVKQYIPGVKTLPVSLAVLAAYTRLTATMDLSGVYTGDNQKGVLSGNAITAQILVSKAVRNLILYGAIGMNQSTVAFDVNGDYFIDKLNPGGQSLTQPFSLSDPYSFDFHRWGVRATAGVRVKAGPAVVHGDYTYVDSRGQVTLGAGVSFR